MRKVVTINKKVDVDVNLKDIMTSVEVIKLNGLNNEVKTIIYPQEKNIAGYNAFNIVFFKKVNITGILDGKPFDSILRKYEIPLLVKESRVYALTYGECKGTIARAALKRIRNDTPIKCSPVKMDLSKVYACILSNIENVEVYSGWFSKLGDQLKNALLQGSGVNEDGDWTKYKNKAGAELKNIQFKIFNDKYTSGSIVLSISSRGFIFTNSLIEEKDFFDLVERILEVLDKNKLILDAEDEKEETITLVVDDGTE